MSTFTESQHPRGTGGRFAAKAKPGAGVALGPEDDAGPPADIAPDELLTAVTRDGRDWDVETVALRDGWSSRDWEEYEDARELGGVRAQLMTSGEDGAVLVQVDTDDLPPGATVRVCLNDGPPVFDGNPERDEPRAGRPLSAGDLESQAAVLGMMQREARIRWTPDGGQTQVEGTVRVGTHDAEGDRRAFEDIRDSYLRVTADPGVEATIPFTEAADLYASGLLAECG